MTSKISGFSDYYNQLSQDLSKPNLDQNTILKLVTKNMEAIASLSDKKNEGLGLTFNKNGEVTVDTWSMTRPMRSMVKKNVISYSSYSEDIRNLKIFTSFVQKFVKSRNINDTKLFDLKKLITTSKKGLESLEKLQNPEDVKKIINASVKKLEKTEDNIRTLLERSSLEPHSAQKQIQDYTRYLTKQNIPDNEKINLLQSKIKDLFNPLLEKTDLKEMQKQREELEKQVKKINEKIEKALAEKVPGSEQLMEEKVVIQKEILNIKEMEDTHPKSIFQKEPFKTYAAFTEDLKSYSNRTDKEFLLLSLMISQPDITTLDKLEEELTKAKDNSLTIREQKNLERQLVQDSGLFSGAFPLIEHRKLVKKADFEKAPPDSRTLKLTRAAAKLATAGGFAALSVVFPKASFTLFLIPDLVKSSYQEVKSAWDGKSEVEQAKLLKDLKELVNDVKKDPATALKNVKKQYDEKSVEGQKVVALVTVITKAIETYGPEAVIQQLSKGEMPTEEGSKEEVVT